MSSGACTPSWTSSAASTSLVSSGQVAIQRMPSIYYPKSRAGFPIVRLVGAAAAVAGCSVGGHPRELVTAAPAGDACFVLSDLRLLRGRVGRAGVELASAPARGLRRRRTEDGAPAARSQLFRRRA